nr:unnamed protein product [Digitaria exilis]
MEAAASTLSSLLSTLRVDGPWTPPGTWELVTPESGAARVSGLGVRPRQEPIYELTSVTDDTLVRLALHALYGVKSSLDDIDELFVLFSSNPADRTSNRVANVEKGTAQVEKDTNVKSLMIKTLSSIDISV